MDTNTLLRAVVSLLPHPSEEHRSAMLADVDAVFPAPEADVAEEPAADVATVTTAKGK